jgi:long-chain acyl-CoA synthetase
VAYLFLPLAHMFAQAVQLSAVAVGAVIAYCSGGPSAVMSDCVEVRPTCLPSVPRIFEKVYAEFARRMPAETIAAAVATGQAVALALRAGTSVQAELEHVHDEFDVRLFARVRAAFGGRIRVAVCGAAPVAPEILEFFRVAGVPVFEGYGLSEAGGVATLNTPAATRIGSVGRAAPGCEIRIAGDREILIRGPHVFAGYWNNAEATAEVLVDGWLRTGDLGVVDKDGFLSISGRKKDIIITAGGKNLTPANLENDLRQSPWISQAVMLGDRRPYPVALLTLDAEQVAAWARQRGILADLTELARHPLVRALIQQVVDQANARYAKVAQIKKFAILDQDLSQTTGELTPTLKVKRHVVQSRYADVLDALYAEPR